MFSGNLNPISVIFFLSVENFVILRFNILGRPVSKEALDEVAELSGVMTIGADYLPPAV